MQCSSSGSSSLQLPWQALIKLERRRLSAPRAAAQSDMQNIFEITQPWIRFPLPLPVPLQAAAQHTLSLSQINWKSYTHRWPTPAAASHSKLESQSQSDSDCKLISWKQSQSSCLVLWPAAKVFFQFFQLPFGFIIASGTRCTLSPLSPVAVFHPFARWRRLLY